MITPANPARVLDEQVRALYQGLPPIIAVHLIVGGAMVATLRHVFPGPGLWIWSIAMLAMLLMRAAFYWHYKKQAGHEAAQRHSLYFVLGAALSGLLWGIAGAVFFAPTLEYQLFVLFILVGMGAGAVSSLTAYMPAFLAYFPVTLLPVSVRLIATEQPVTIGLGVMTLVYVAALTFFARNISRSLAETWRLRFENIDLVRELSVQKLQAEQANLAKSRFLAAASHDLRQPLHALNLYVTLLEDAGNMPRVRELSARISQSVGTLQNLFAALLDISKLEAGMLKPESETFAVQPMLDRLSNDFAVEAAYRGLTLDIPQSHAIVRTDPALFEQILRNYLSNALRYTRQGQVTLKVHADGDTIRFEVSDTGIGIDPSQQQRIFQEFYQVKSTELDSGEGLGLGLAIVSRVARLLGLDIGVHSIPGQGSTFFVTAPAGASDPIRQPLLPAWNALPTIDRTVHLLVVDDDPGIRESTQALLESWGHRATTASTLEEALRAAASEPPDGIVIDYRLGNVHTGIDVLNELEKHHGMRPTVVITGDVGSTPMRALMASGRQWLHKPVGPAKLRAFVQSVQRDVLAHKR